MKTGRLFVIFLILAPLSLGLLRLASAVATDVVVTSQPNDANVNDSEPSVAVSPINPNLVLVGSIDVTHSRVRYSFSSDGGSTFPTGDLMPLPAGNSIQADPSVAFDRAGNAWYVGYASNTPGGPPSSSCTLSLFVTMEDSSLAGWAAPQIFESHNSETDGCQDKPYLAIDNTGGSYDGTAYVAWSKASNCDGSSCLFDIFLTSHRPNTPIGSVYWATPIQLSNDHMSRFSGLDVGPDGLVYITWVTFTSKTLYLSRYDPTSGSIAGPFNVQHLTTGSLMAGQIHSVAVDKTQPETVYVAYEDAPNSATKLDIWLTKSTDRGGSWSTPRKANWDDSTPTDQYLPWITTTKGSSSNGIGRVDLVFYDKRNDPTFNSAYDVYLATSADRGETFQANIRVSDIPSSTTDYLDYIGMTSRPKDARPVWTGQRTVSAADSDILTDKQAFQDLDVRSSLTSGAQIASPGPAVSVDNSADGYLPTEVTFSLTPTPSSHIIRAVSCSQNPSNTMRVFDHWAYDSSFANVVVNSNSITGSLTGDSVLTAYYRETSGTCPSSTLSAGFSYTPSNPVQYYCVTFASTTTGGTTPYSYSWSFGDINPTIDSSTCHGGNTSNVGHSYASPGSYIVTLTVTDSSAAVSTHSQTVSIASGGQGSGGLITRNSPYISTYDGNLWHLDNNLIPQSLYPNHPSGTGVIDSYKIQQPIASTSGTYSLRVDELGLDQAYLDRVSLVTVDHDSSVNLGVSPDGQLLTYGNPYSPVSAASSQGLDVSATVRGLDGIYYQGYPGDWVNVDFAERLDLSLGAKLVVRYSSIDRAPTAVQVMTSIEQWSNVTLLTPRTFWSTGIVDLKTFLPDAQGKSRVRILLASYQRIDYVGLDVTPQATMAVQQAGLVKAVNSYGLDVTPTLQASDDQQVELLPGQGISLTFATPTTSPVGNRDFIITIEGYYVELA